MDGKRAIRRFLSCVSKYLPLHLCDYMPEAGTTYLKVFWDTRSNFQGFFKGKNL